MNKSNKTETVIDTEDKQVVDRGEAGWGKKRGKGDRGKIFQLQNKWVMGINVECGEYSQ